MGIDPSSQTLVYSKTSLQIDLIKAATPRAIYFDDDTYVAWIPDTNMVEMTTMDSALGPVFYTLPNSDPSAAHLDRETSRCLTCHDTFSMMGGGVPRFLFMSSPVTVAGEPLTNDISTDTTDATPHARALGRLVCHRRAERLLPPGQPPGRSGAASPRADCWRASRWPADTVEKLDRLFDTKPYLTDHSDVVALLVFEHQVYIEN